MEVGPAHACAVGCACTRPHKKKKGLTLESPLFLKILSNFQHPFKGRGIGVTQLPEHLSQRMERTLRKGAVPSPPFFGDEFLFHNRI